MKDQSNLINPFKIKESWKAYNQFFWFNQPEELIPVAEKIVAQLPTASTSQPIQVLVLGIGTGTFELPLLAAIENVSHRKVRIVALDANKEPMAFASMLVQSGLNSLPRKTDELIQLIDTYGWKDIPSDDFWQSGEHLFICEDLDFDNQALKVQPGKISFAAFPSRWGESLEQVYGNALPFRGFDLCLASFFLPHLTWWRSTLVSALSLLREGGIFLHSHVRGDADILEGKTSAAPKILKDSGRTDILHDNSILKSVFLNKVYGFYADKEVARYHTVPRPSTPIHPFGVENFFSYIEGHGLKNLSTLSYLVQTQVDKNTYYQLLCNRTNSPFRVVEKIVGTPYYNDILQKLDKTISKEIPDTKDSLVNRFLWSGCQLFNLREFYNSPLSSKFKDRALAASQRQEIRQYELEAATVDVGLSQFQESSEFAKEIVKNMASSGLISSSCVGGLIVSLKEDDPSIAAFVNPLLQSRSTVMLTNFLIDLCLYLRFREEKYSNTGTLVRRLIPKSNKTCIFTCKSQDNEELSEVIDINIVQHNSFKEVQFILSNSLKKLMREEAANLNSIKTVREAMRKMLEIKNYEVGIFTINPYKDNYLDIFDDNTREDWRRLINLKQLTEDMRKKVEQVGGDTVDFLEELEDCITEKLINGIVPIPIISSFHTCVTYPAVYRVNDNLLAEDAVILFYDSSFRLEEEIEHEFKKVQYMYSTVGMRKTQERGEEQGSRQGKSEGRRSVTEQFGHETRLVNLSVRKMSRYIEDELRVREDNFHIMALLREAAFDYIDLWASNASDDSYPINLEDVIESAKRIGFLRKFHSVEPPELLQNKELFLNLLSRINVQVVTTPQAINLGYSASLEKAIKAAISNAVQHSLPKNRSFKDMLSLNEVYTILLLHGESSLAIYTSGEYCINNAKPASTLSVIQDQLENIKGVVPSMTTLYEKDLNETERELLTQHHVSLPVVHTLFTFDRDVWLQQQVRL
ncbi:hypothetical protein NIES2107_73050 (plasmid) [Nostoc carneum NIES-2107]|nr:hypothetical protein NIES2107_73050 [Nostoc carneum NIES-2107]